MLLVEDNEFNQVVAVELLHDVAGMEVVLAPDGQAAVDEVMRSAPELVLMDVQMPVMDGCEATRQIRADPAHAGLPIIAMTAHAMQRDRDNCLAAGMNDHVVKPFVPDELFAIIARWLPPLSAEREAEAEAISSELGLKKDPAPLLRYPHWRRGPAAKALAAAPAASRPRASARSTTR